MGLYLYPLPDSIYKTNNETTWHGATVSINQDKGSLNYNCPIGTNVRAMTSGTVSFIGEHEDGRKSINIAVTNSIYKLPSQKKFFIRYINVESTLEVGNSIMQGDKLGTTIEDGLQLEFSLNDAGEVFNSTLSEDKLNQDQKQAYAIWESIIGNTTSRGRCWEVMATEATQQSVTISGSIEGGLDRNTLFFNEPAAATKYFEAQFKDGFLDGCNCPNSIAELNDSAHKPLRRLLQSCKGEFGGWPFACVTYAKLYRATIIGSDWSSSAATLEEWLSNTYSTQTGWMGTANTGNISYSSSSDLSLAQAIHKNLCLPGIYGAELHTGTEEFKNSIIKGASLIPLQNGWVNNMWSGSTIDRLARTTNGRVCGCLFNTSTNQDEIEIYEQTGRVPVPRGGVFLFYRLVDSFYYKEGDTHYNTNAV